MLAQTFNQTGQIQGMALIDYLRGQLMHGLISFQQTANTVGFSGWNPTMIVRPYALQELASQGCFLRRQRRMVLTMIEKLTGQHTLNRNSDVQE